MAIGINIVIYLFLANRIMSFESNRLFLCLFGDSFMVSSLAIVVWLFVKRRRTAKRVAQLREQEGSRSTDVETKATQCIDRTPCLTACLFCFSLLVVNLLFLQWLYVKGRLKLE